MSQNQEIINCPPDGGNTNERLLIAALNDKKFSELSENLQQLIVEMKEEDILPNTLIKVYKEGGQQKTDLVVEIENQKYNISVKCGRSNSVHQEKVELFLKSLKKEGFDISEDLANDIRYYSWSDGTLDGSGKVSDRVGARGFPDAYPEITENLREFCKNNKRMLIERFIIKGRNNNSTPDFIYYGTPDKGIVVKSKDILDWLCKDGQESPRAAIPVGRLTLQPWNSRLTFDPQQEHKRGQIQLKWSNVGKDLIKIRKEVSNAK